jgi:hypothetical protein
MHEEYEFENQPFPIAFEEPAGNVLRLPSRAKTRLTIIFDPEASDLDTEFEAEAVEMFLRAFMRRDAFHSLVENVASRVIAANTMKTLSSLSGDKSLDDLLSQTRQMLDKQLPRDERPRKRGRRPDNLDPEP